MACSTIPVIPADKGGYDDTPFAVDGARKIIVPVIVEVTLSVWPDCKTDFIMIGKLKKRKK
jgi:hypothetical protein